MSAKSSRSPAVDLEGLLVVAVDGRWQARAGQDELVGTGGGDDRRLPLDLLAVHPRAGSGRSRSARSSCAASVTVPAHALDPADDVGAALADRHQVGDADLAALGGVRRLQHARCRRRSGARTVCSSSGPTSQRPLRRSPSSAAKHAGESNCGRHSQSSDPSMPMRAAVWPSPIAA